MAVNASESSPRSLFKSESRLADCLFDRGACVRGCHGSCGAPLLLYCTRLAVAVGRSKEPSKSEIQAGDAAGNAHRIEGFDASVLLLTPLASWATSCTAQAELGSLDRDALSAASAGWRRPSWRRIQRTASQPAAAGGFGVGRHSRHGGTGCAARKRWEFPVARCVSFGR